MTENYAAYIDLNTFFAYLLLLYNIFEDTRAPGAISGHRLSLYNYEA